MNEEVATPQRVMEQTIPGDRSVLRPGLVQRETARGWTPRRLRVVSSKLCQGMDLILLGGAFLGVVIIPFLGHGNGSFHELLQLRVSLRNIIIAGFCVSTWRVVLMSVGVYSPHRMSSMQDYVFRCVVGLNSCTAVVGLIEVVLGGRAVAWHVVELFWLVSLGLMAFARVMLVGLDHALRPLMRRKRSLIIVGSGERARKVLEELKVHTEWDYELVGFVDSEPQGGFVPANMMLGGLDRLEQILMHTVVDEVVIALPMKSQWEVVGRAIEICQMLGIQSQYFTDYFGTAVTKRRVSAGPDSGRVALEVVTMDSRLLLKRLIDIVLSLWAILVLLPVMVAVGLAVKWTSPGPILFKQKRFGLNKRTFSMLKFRSMSIDAESRQAGVEHLNETSGPAFKIRNDPRVTPIGNFIRKFSLDELPQLFNVLIGDMSLVGPRPLPARDVSRFPESWLMRRFSVKPGVTCLWQIGGRSNTDFDRWIALDLEYIDNWSLSLDFLILLKTLPAVLTSRGAS
jgi:exopolysaccharide biosynthesis polyprenyl glycosylphosphotransferase